MLQSIGDSLKGYAGHKWRKWFAYLVLGLLSLIFAAWGAYGIVNLNFGGSNYAAEADGAKISLEEARRSWLQQQAQWQQSLGGAELPAQLRAKLQDQVLERMIRSALLTQRTEELGYRVSQSELSDAVRQVPAFQIGGQYSADAAKDVLARVGITEDVFEAQLRADVARTQLEGGIRGSEFITPVETKRIAELENQEREVRYFVLPLAQFKSDKVDEAAVQAYYKAHESQFMTPESAHLQYAELRLETLAAQETISDADLHAAYDKHRSQLEMPEKRHARHILITDKDDAAALAQAQQVLAQAKAGKDFGELARQYSKDPGSARNGGDLGWADRNSFVKPFADALFSMSVGEIRGPVKTQYGYHIIKLEEIQAGKGKSFEEARPELEAQLRKDHATDRFGDIQEQLQSKLQEPGADLAALAQQYHLQQGDLPAFAKGAGAPPLGAARPLQDLVFGDPPLAVGHAGGPVLVGDDRLVIVKVLQHKKPEARPLSEVRDTIVAALGKEQGTKAALAAAQAARAKLEAGASFDTVAQELKVSADPAHFIGRSDPSIPAPLRDAAFQLARPAGKPVYSALTVADGGAAVLALSAVRIGAAHDPKDQVGRSRQEADRLGDAAAFAYVEEVRRAADVRKNPNAFE